MVTFKVSRVRLCWSIPSEELEVILRNGKRGTERGSKCCIFSFSARQSYRRHFGRKLMKTWDGNQFQFFFLSTLLAWILFQNTPCEWVWNKAIAATVDCGKNRTSASLRGTVFAAGGLPVSMVTVNGACLWLLWHCLWHEAGTAQKAGAPETKPQRVTAQWGY